MVFESNRLYENKVPDWIKSHSETMGMNISDNAADLMTTLLSSDLTKIDNELQKLGHHMKEIEPLMLSR